MCARARSRRSPRVEFGNEDPRRRRRVRRDRAARNSADERARTRRHRRRSPSTSRRRARGRVTRAAHVCSNNTNPRFRHLKLVARPRLSRARRRPDARRTVEERPSASPFAVIVARDERRRVASSAGSPFEHVHVWANSVMCFRTPRNESRPLHRATLTRATRLANVDDDDKNFLRRSRVSVGCERPRDVAKRRTDGFACLCTGASHDARGARRSAAVDLIDGRDGSVGEAMREGSYALFRFEVTCEPQIWKFR